MTGHPVRALAALVPLLCACRTAETACFRIQSRSGSATTRSGGQQTRIFEAFVLANPPEEPDALRLAVERHCGRQPAPEAPAYSVQWWVFKETRSTPRTLVAGRDGEDSLDRHQEDLILDLVAQRDECGDFVSTFFFRRGEMVSRRTVPAPGARLADAGPSPSWCRERGQP